MIEIGVYNTLEILRETSVGLFLGDEEGNDVLLPNKYVPKRYEIGDTLAVFCYLDHEERLIATTLKPKVIKDGFALLEVAAISDIGAFLDWGLEKHLFVPFREQHVEMKEGRHYLVRCYLDEKTERLAASSRLNKYLSNADITLKQFDQVALIVSGITDLGTEVIVNQKHKGLVYANEIFQDLKLGQELIGFVKKVREDGKLNISLQELGYKNIEPTASKILEVLKKQGGFLGLTDKSAPEDIKGQLNMSKKSFKKGVGNLYKSRIIQLQEDGIYLV